MNFKKRIIIAVSVLACIVTISFFAFNIIGLNNNNIIEKGFIKKSKNIQFKSNKDYEYINFEIMFFKNDIKNDKVYYTILNPKQNIIHKGTINYKNNNTGELTSRGMKGIWKIKLISENKNTNLEYKCHIKTGNYK